MSYFCSALFHSNCTVSVKTPSAEMIKTRWGCYFGGLPRKTPNHLALLVQREEDPLMFTFRGACLRFQPKLIRQARQNISLLLLSCGTSSVGSTFPRRGSPASASVCLCYGLNCMEPGVGLCRIAPALTCPDSSVASLVIFLCVRSRHSQDCISSATYNILRKFCNTLKLGAPTGPAVATATQSRTRKQKWAAKSCRPSPKAHVAVSTCVLPAKRAVRCCGARL